ncbi:LOW QUALITY PROTEIN: hypothetical protein PHMEG_00036951 [Phytophthora megakarya]|uniref:PiggyBac transposable element-derived protein domain-containing protein n=1 Tax=Phytophthora megakarya TaxID=4795 RepID=A0A225UKP3_9STRA|nr:LOW QUALITY PROTEIN: hypothetical protein PHMEG_00036951 [Phytophthora megakarya]
MWKLRPSRFLSGWTLGSKFSFDEGIIPATSKRNGTRMFMPDKPHRYGTKLFMVCDSITAYCHRNNTYMSHASFAALKKRGDSEQQAFDSKTGAAAVFRNMRAVFGERQRGFRLVAIDQFYSSVALALQVYPCPSTC